MIGASIEEETQGRTTTPNLPLRQFTVTRFDYDSGRDVQTEKIISNMASPINEEGDRWTFSNVKFVPGLGMVQSLVRSVSGVLDVAAEDVPESRLSIN